MLTSIENPIGATTMSTTCCLPRPIPLARAWPLRWMDALADAARGLRATWAEARRERAEARAPAWDVEAAAQLSDHVLRDIGAPDWLRVEAAAHRAGDHRSAIELRAGASGLFERSF